MLQRVKRLTPEDTVLLQGIAEIDSICLPNEAWSFASFLAETEKEGGLVLAALDEAGDPVGFLTAFRAMDEAELTSVGVSPSHRRQGIGDALLSEMFAQLGESVTVFLEVRASNESAIGMYEKHGFVKAGIRKRFYHDPVEDAVIMSR